ncbi:hypothetical protein FB45DRAFT_307646 [Roridomyces roridus]|uniref:Uncharacterized protein n=1 Tax=Roridomyces roridus TaxID=1738132 RepID=A0AAD7B6F3_9AGAR|nr:hypothetical protein FB45DRAFT_307646 [Roridomyces roridus]
MAMILCSVEVPKATEGQEAMDGQDATDGEEATNGQHATDGEEATNGQDASQAIPQPTIEAENMRKGLLDGSITLTAAQYPCCFYPSLDFIYDPNNPQLGLFRSELLLRACFPMFFQSQTDLVCRSYVIFGQRQIPLSRAPTMAPRRQGMQEPSARVKLRDDGSPTPAASHNWTTKDRKYSYVTLFDNVVKLFETNPTSDWVVETLEWFQTGIFGSGDFDDEGSDDDDMNDINALILKNQAAAAAS